MNNSSTISFKTFVALLLIIPLMVGGIYYVVNNSKEANYFTGENVDCSGKDVEQLYANNKLESILIIPSYVNCNKNYKIVLKNDSSNEYDVKLESKLANKSNLTDENSPFSFYNISEESYKLKANSNLEIPIDRNFFHYLKFSEPNGKGEVSTNIYITVEEDIY